MKRQRNASLTPPAGYTKIYHLEQDRSWNKTPIEMNPKAIACRYFAKNSLKDWK
jgi:hypothetical protein